MWTVRGFRPVKMSTNQNNKESKSIPQYHILGNTDELYAVTYSKSNRIINSKGRSTALGLKIFAFGISNVQVDKDGQLYSVMRGMDLQKLLGSKSHALYQQIKNVIRPKDTVTPSILDWRIFIEDDETQRIAGVNIITDAVFEGGQLRLSFNNKIKDDIYNLKTNYTILSLVEVAKLKSPYSIRLYEIFKSEMDYQRAILKSKDRGIYYVTYEIDELKRILGVIDPADENGNPLDGKSKTKKKSTTAAKRALYPSYTDFKRRLLERVKEELNSNTEVHMDYREKKGGIGGKVQAIEFVLYRQDIYEPKDSVEANAGNMEDILKEAYEMMSEDLSRKDIRSICEAAGYDMDKVKKAYALAGKQKHISNLTGWMIDAVKNDYSDAVHKESGMKRKNTSASNRKDNPFNHFEQHDYDFDAIEAAILSRQKLTESDN